MANYIGLDLGGTNIKAGVVDSDKRVLAKMSVPTPAQLGPAAVADAMGQAAHAVASQAGLAMGKIDCIGIGAPGPLNIKRGVIRAAPNMPGWHEVPIRDWLSQRTGRPAVLENDANAAAFGEFWAGAGKHPNIRHMVMLTLGTGVGSGLIVNGALVHGAFDSGGEAGHMIVVPNGRLCGCGQRGCIEAYASASSTAKRLVEALGNGEPSSLKQKFNQGLDKISAKDVFEAAKAGDPLACRIVDETTTYLGIACVNLCRLLDPQMIVFAGGMILAGDYLFERVRVAFRVHTWKVVESPVEIVPAVLGNDAGIIGAAGVAWQAQHAEAQTGKVGTGG